METPEKQIIRLGVVDDHQLYRHGLIRILQQWPETFEVCLEAGNGKEFLEAVRNTPAENRPHIALVDYSMPVMDGPTLCDYLQTEFSDISVLIVSMIEKEEAIIQLLKKGIKGYLSKDINPAELQEALLSISRKGHYYTDLITGKLLNHIHKEEKSKPLELAALTEREWECLRWSCTDLSYKEIAEKMHVSYKTVDTYRNSLFIKLDVKSRIGLVLFALRNELVSLEK